MVENKNILKGLVNPTEFAGVVKPDVVSPKGGEGMKVDARKAASELLENNKFVADLKESKAYQALRDEYAKQGIDLDAGLKMVASDPDARESIETYNKLKAKKDGSSASDKAEDEEALSIATQALALRAALAAAKRTNNPGVIKDISAKLDQLHSRAAKLVSGEARALATRVVSSTQAYAETVYGLALAASTALLQTIGSLLSSAASAVGSLLGDGLSTAARNFLSGLNDNGQYAMTRATIGPDGNINFVKNDATIRGDEIKKNFEVLNGKNPLNGPGKLQILENEDVSGKEGATNESMFTQEKLEATYMKKSLTTLEDVKTAMLLSKVSKGDMTMDEVKTQIKSNRKLFKEAEDQIDTVLASRKALIEAETDDDRKKAAEELKKAKAKLKTTLRKIADEVMGEKSAGKISAATDVATAGTSPVPTTETAKKVTDPSQKGTGAAV